MTIERLNELKELTQNLYGNGYVSLLYCDLIIVLIDAAIARSSTDCSTRGSEVEQRMRDIVADWKPNDLELALSDVCGMSKTGRDKWVIELSEDDAKSMKIQSTLMQVLDAAIARQSVTGEEINAAIADIATMPRYDPDMRRGIIANTTATLAITALQAQIQPVGEESTRSQMKRTLSERLHRIEQLESLNQSLMAELRQMPKEPCEWMCYSEERWDGKKYRFFRCPQCRKATAVKSPFCPSCGRELKGGE